MARYAAPNSFWIEDDLFNSDRPLISDVSVPEHKAVDTGLLWPDGKPIMRLPNPIGFGRDKDW